MHRSRLAGFIIDCETDNLDQAARFWSQALGYPTRQLEEAGYVGLRTPDDEVHIEVQRVDHPSRVHIDIETDDIEAEVARLEALGATRIATVRRWCVMQAPTGQRFCVVQPQRQDFNLKSNSWN